MPARPPGGEDRRRLGNVRFCDTAGLAALVAAACLAPVPKAVSESSSRYLPGDRLLGRPLPVRVCLQADVKKVSRGCGLGSCMVIAPCSWYRSRLGT